MVTKEQIIDGLAKYLDAEVMNKINDKSFKIVLTMALVSMKKNPKILDDLLHNEILSQVVNEQNGQYDLDNLFSVLQEVITKYGDFPLTIPPVKFISPNEKVLRFSMDDVSKLKSYINGGVA